MEQAHENGRLDPKPVQHLLLQQLQLGAGRTAVVRDGVRRGHPSRLRERIGISRRSLETVVDGHATPPGLIQVRHEILYRSQHLVDVHVHNRLSLPPVTSHPLANHVGHTANLLCAVCWLSD